VTTLTERYLTAALRGIPERQRADVEGELRSSIADAVEDRVTAGEDRAAAEKAVLEGLGNPTKLAAEYAGRPLYLIGPELFLVYRHVLTRLVGTVVPILGAVLVAVSLMGGAGYVEALVDGIGGAFNVGVHLVFWVTVVFAFLERADAARETRSEIVGETGRWTVDMLPQPAADRVGVSDTVGELFTTLLTIGGLLFLRDVSWVTDDAGRVVSLFDPAFTTFWLPALIAILVALGVLQVIVFLVGRWTVPLASGFAALEIAFAVPVVVLTLSGSVITPAFAAGIGWPPLAEGDGPVMIAIAVVTTLVTAWEIFDAFRHALRARSGRPALGLGQTLI
jgi:HAAS domain-containing protein